LEQSSFRQKRITSDDGEVNIRNGQLLSKRKTGSNPLVFHIGVLSAAAMDALRGGISEPYYDVLLDSDWHIHVFL
jgi:hypothetical protein